MDFLRCMKVLLLIAVFSATALAKSETTITVTWPTEQPALKLTFAKFQQVAVLAGKSTFLSTVTIQNLTEKQIPHAGLTVYLMGKDNVRIGEGQLRVSDLNPGQSAKEQFQFESVGIPIGLVISANKDMLVKTVPLRIVSVPSWAKVQVDGNEVGLTPVIVKLTVGVHTLGLQKEGYAPNSTPLEIAPDELPGGTISIELGGLSQDVVELRNGTVLLGDVVSLTMVTVVVRVDGKEQTYERNQIKKMMLVERENTPR